MSATVNPGQSDSRGGSGNRSQSRPVQKGQVRPVTTTIRSRNAIPVAKSSTITATSSTTTTSTTNHTDKSQVGPVKTETTKTGSQRKVAPNVTKDPDKSPVKTKIAGKNDVRLSASY